MKTNRDYGRYLTGAIQKKLGIKNGIKQREINNLKDVENAIVEIAKKHALNKNRYLMLENVLLRDEVRESKFKIKVLGVIAFALVVIKVCEVII